MLCDGCDVILRNIDDSGVTKTLSVFEAFEIIFYGEEIVNSFVGNKDWKTVSCGKFWYFPMFSFFVSIYFVKYNGLHAKYPAVSVTASFFPEHCRRHRP
jgi:hypothetical protein